MTFTVNTIVDEFDTPSGANVSLREAVRDAALPANPDSDTITFASPLSGGNITIAVENEEIAIASNVTIDATSLPVRLTVSGGSQGFRIFSVAGDASLTLSGLVLANGGAGTFAGQGGAIFNEGTVSLTNCSLESNTSSEGGAIYTVGALTLTDCSLSTNTAGSGGGAICNVNAGTVTLAGCTFSGNSAFVGGAVFNGSSSSTTLTRCTLAGNSTPFSNGGAIYNSGTVLLAHCTLSGNAGKPTPGNSGGAIYNSASGSLGLDNTIAAGNTPNNITGSFATGGSNLTGGDPLLAPLGSYGGPTKTMALLPGSPARDGAVGSSATTDQRGFPIVGAPDLGAYESGTANSFTTWAWETVGATLTPGADGDDDGAINGLEYALRRDAKSNDAVLSPFLAVAADGGWRFSFRYQAGARDLRYVVERNGDLGNESGWIQIYRYNKSSNDIDRLFGVSSDENAVAQVVTLTDPFLGSNVFWRLRVDVLP